ncbi:hypothetical protein KC19_VG305300 [Ceratodon purpureus]|uniref:F-box domain-containing protein n=1 Tax=Ceratodon purpureus TaxID=3225 RepID=A0A8T0HV53_CERPU|nr:hypothetical protein KC19_VG305300 [Ceratodon purpureus]
MAQEEIDRRVWSKIPEVILEQVLRHLPLSAMLRFQSVCKHWKLFLNSVEFRNSYAHTTAEESYIVFVPIHVQQLTLCPLYNPFVNKWRHVDLAYLQCTLKGLGCLRIKEISSASGLQCLCAGSATNKDEVYVVSNPLTRECRVLPSLKGKLALRGLAIEVDKDFGCYKVFAIISQLYREFEMHVYESSTKAWQFLFRLPQTCPFCVSSVLFNGTYYSLQMHDLVLLQHDFAQNAWAASAVTLAEIGKSMKLLVSTGRLFHVSIVDKRIPVETPGNFSRVLDISVFELKVLSGECEQIEAFTTPYNGRGYFWDAVGYTNSLILLLQFPHDHVKGSSKTMMRNNSVEFGFLNLQEEPKNLENFTLNGLFGEDGSQKLLDSLTFDLHAKV